MSKQENINLHRAKIQEKMEALAHDRHQRRLARDNRTNADQLKLLDKRLGINVGAKRERARLCTAKA